MSQSPRKHVHRRTNSAVISPGFFSSTPSTPIRNPVYSNISAWDSPDPGQHASPTKAAAQSRLNHEVNTVTTWLETLFGAPVPSHLRGWLDEVLSASNLDGGLIGNDDFGTPGKTAGARGEGVLETLKAIKQVNIAADHLSGLLADAKTEEVHLLEQQIAASKKQRSEGLQARAMLDQVLDGLGIGGSSSLEELVSTAVTLGIDEKDIEECADGNLSNFFLRRLLDASNSRMLLSEQVNKLNTLNEDMLREEQSHGSDVGLHETGSEQLDDEASLLAMQASQFSRDGKQINLKILEYEDRLRGLDRQLSRLRSERTSLQDVVDARARVEARKMRVKGLQQRFAAFHGLPADLDASRSEVKRAMNELETLRRKRENLFERIGNVS